MSELITTNNMKSDAKKGGARLFRNHPCSKAQWYTPGLFKKKKGPTNYVHSQSEVGLISFRFYSTKNQTRVGATASPSVFDHLQCQALITRFLSERSEHQWPITVSCAGGSPNSMLAATTRSKSHLSLQTRRSQKSHTRASMHIGQLHPSHSMETTEDKATFIRKARY